jgi:putative glutamine amidotransferase
MSNLDVSKRAGTLAHRPAVAIVCDHITFAGHDAYRCFSGYAHAVRRAADANPLLVPADASLVDLPGLLAGIDGLLLPGSPSNVAAERYGAPALDPATCTDPMRDALVFDLLPAAIEAGVPVLGICRGFQELNVVAGGTLDAAVHTRPGRLDHREGSHDRPIEQWYEHRHPVDLEPGGLLAELAGAPRAHVNSLHHQGIDRLGRGLRVEATAPDGLVEAFTVEAAGTFALGVQWHPEMRVDGDAFARAIFRRFGQACAARAAHRLGPPSLNDR